PRLTAVLLGRPISLTRKPVSHRWATPELRGGSNDASAGVLPPLGNHLRTGRPSACPTSCLPLAAPSSLARDPHVALGGQPHRRCRDVPLGVLAPSLMAHSALLGHDGMGRRRVRPGEVLCG